MVAALEAGCLHRQMRILITGIAGMLGRDLVRTSDDKRTLYGLGRSRAKFKQKHVKYFSCDLLNLKQIKRCVDKIQPDMVIHTAAMTRVDDCELKSHEAYRGNELATQFLVRALAASKPLLIHISTDYVFDGKNRSPYMESDLPRPVSVYGSTKWQAEQVVQNSGLPWIILRTAWL